MADEELKTYTFYKIEFKDSRYIGKTTNLKQRQREHRSDCFNPKSKSYGYKLYEKLRELGSTKDEIICQKLTITENLTKKEAAFYEGNWYEHLKPDLNDDVPNRSISEYRDASRDEINKMGREYYLKNRDELKRKRNENRDELKRKRNENREELNRKAKEYYLKNREELKRKKRERYAAKKAQN